MGSTLAILGEGQRHINAQAQIDAARTLQSANNGAAKTIAAAQTTVRDANNDAARSIADAQNTVQAAGNRQAMQLTEAKKILQNSGNASADRLAEAQRVVQNTRNEAAASKSSLALWGESVGNQRKLDQAGREINDISEGVAKNIDATTRGNAYAQIDASAALGASIASAAAAGVGGSTTMAYNDTIRLRMALSNADTSKTLDMAGKTAARAQGLTMQNAVGGMSNLSENRASLDYTPIFAEHDVSTYVADQDYSRHIASIDYTPYTPKLDYTTYVDDKAMSGMQIAATFVAAAGATYFAGPQAGEAVMDASMAYQKMRTGDMASAQKYGDSALGNAMGGYNTYKSGGEAWGNQFFGNASKDGTMSGASYKI